jgi:hypothetical protein
LQRSLSSSLLRHEGGKQLPVQRPSLACHLLLPPLRVDETASMPQSSSSLIPTLSLSFSPKLVETLVWPPLRAVGPRLADPRRASEKLRLGALHLVADTHKLRSPEPSQSRPRTLTSIAAVAIDSGRPRPPQQAPRAPGELLVPMHHSPLLLLACNAATPHVCDRRRAALPPAMSSRPFASDAALRLVRADLPHPTHTLALPRTASFIFVRE